MANFDQAMQAKRDEVGHASAVLDHIRAAYHVAKTAQADLALYNAATNTAFNAMVDALYSSAERTELGNMLTGLSTLITDWETNHAGVLAGG
jgi:hypothetical protein